jgi:hypothetical protein
MVFVKRKEKCIWQIIQNNDNLNNIILQILPNSCFAIAKEKINKNQSTIQKDVAFSFGY